MDPIHPTVGEAVEFLTTLYEEGLSYSSINSARCALSAILNIPNSGNLTFGEYPEVKRFMRGIFQCKPSLPRYNYKICDVNLVLQYIRSDMPETEHLPLKDLTLKLVMLIALTTAQRGQSLHLLDIQGMVKEEATLTFMLNEHIKQSKPGRPSSEIVIQLKAYPPDNKICVVTTCLAYIEKTKTLRGDESKLFVTYQKPHKRASKDSIRRWIQNMMIRSGIDVTIYRPHSVRAASTSKAKSNNASLLEIMKAAGWSSANTFAKFYDKEIVTERSFAASVLQG
jgi:hypothetical protein